MSHDAPIWGQHLILDLGGCPREQLTAAGHIPNWVKELIGAIDMKAFGEPVLEHFASHSFDAAGFTLMQLIETSNISAHFAENLGQVYIDVFSCKRFDEQLAIEVCKKYFMPTELRSHSLERGLFNPPLLQAV